MEKVVNHMEGVSFKNNPLTTLKIVSASSIFGEKNYYTENNTGRIQNLIKYLASPYLSNFAKVDVKTTEDIMEKAIDAALDYDFKGTLDFAADLRNNFNMRLNPQIILVRATIHPKRVEFNKNFAGYMRAAANKIIHRPDDMDYQLQYYAAIKGSHKNLPNVLKRIWTDRIIKLSSYQIAKYKNIAGRKGLINLARLANTRRIRLQNSFMNQFMEKGDITFEDNEMTWEKYISEHGTSKDSWNWVIDNIFAIKDKDGKFTGNNHMALLRNLRNIENNADKAHQTLALEALVEGVEKGRQFPFRYYTALNNVSKENVKKALSDCVNKAMVNFPKLAGKTVCLSDNSGSAWGALNSEYGTVTIAEIGNLSSAMTSTNSDEGHVAIFGDRLEFTQIQKDDDIFASLEAINAKGKNIGGSTETGIWTFWDKAINDKEWYDNVFIYSDMQAGYSQLYRNAKGNSRSGHEYIDVLEMVKKYRKNVNPKVNVFSIQTAGYDNTILPEIGYRSAILAGWTGKETVFAAEMIKLWNEEDKE
jgi:hypothetical protein